MKRERKPYGGQTFESTSLIFTGLAQNQKVRQVVFVKKYFPVFRYLWSIAAQRRNWPDLRSPQTARVVFFFGILGFLFSFFSESSAVTPFSESSAVTRKPQLYRAFIFRLVVLKKMCNDTSTNVSHQRSARCDESGGKWSGFGFRDFVSRPTYRAPILTYGWPSKKIIYPQVLQPESGFIPLGPQSRWAHRLATIACEKKLTSFRVQSTG